MICTSFNILTLGLFLIVSSTDNLVQAGVVKDIFQKITGTNNKTEDTVKESIPICGNGIFSTPNELTLSPELIFISTKPSRTDSAQSSSQTGSWTRDQNLNSQGISEVSKEFKFHADNVTVEELRRYGFNPEAPISFLIHGFTSGYPLQAWISAIVEAYTIDRETSAYGSSNHHVVFGEHSDTNYEDEANDHSNGATNYAREKQIHRYRGNSTISANQSNERDNFKRDTPTWTQRDRKPINNKRQYEGSSLNTNANHNLIIVNWHYAARGILYPRAVANIPIVASYVTRFINNKLLDEAQVDPSHIQLIGHSLGAHLAGFIGKNTRVKVGRIYGLDPAGPCFGTVSGPLYPASKRLAPSDANEVITIQTNSALLGIEKPLGRYSVFVEGGVNQPGCKESGVLKSISTLTFEGGDFDTIACSHSRAPNLLTYRHNQIDADDNCQMVAYACKDWDSFIAGHCGVCGNNAIKRQQERRSREPNSSPLEPVECYRIGLDWQYPSSHVQASDSSYNKNQQVSNERDKSQSHSSSSILHNNKPNERFSSTKRPSNYGEHFSSANSNYNRDTTTNQRRPAKVDGDNNFNYQRRRRNAAERTNSTDKPLDVSQRRLQDDDNSLEPIVMFLRTGDTQPYCTYHYQVVLELNEPFGRKKPPMSIILQDSEPDGKHLADSNLATSFGQQQRRSNAGQRNSLSNDQFGHKFDERTYTHLLTSNKKLARIDHATLIFRDGLQDGHRKLKALHVNYMSHTDQMVRNRLSSRLCPVKTDIDTPTSGSRNDSLNRIYFKPCVEQQQQQHQLTQHDQSFSSQSHSTYGQSGPYDREHR